MRWSAQEKKVSITQPNTIAAYNTYMGGVDRMDQNINNYRVSIKSKKWWFSCFAFATTPGNSTANWTKENSTFSAFGAMSLPLICERML
uniref:PiggyBac transposable element-derived protein domain-containing protein n=1 Tax=Acrobeloides nanus TaxID=290746 RepID=A0A914DYM9_9BILA